jgi:(1->4)-alpha-D-glucan 1-alpha-D-glucosylmutase
VGRGDSDGLQVVALATRLSERLRREGGWADSALQLPPGRWLDLLSGRPIVTESSGAPRLAELLVDLPVALIVRDEHA